MQEVKSQQLVKILKELKSQGYTYLKKITAVDYNDKLELVYIIADLDNNKQEIITTKIDANKPEIDSVIEIYPAAEWYEREVFEMFGISFRDGVNKRLLLEEWNGLEYPLRKSFIWGKDYKKEE
ncbi:MAG: NADH-quinone oxidoreductase subunit C [Candidatus Micrarchaeota archaeon]|nr:MAG: NADH-quinone oxidoreductase subunit C [Candidatus Micrarchaeota archaeon]